MLSNVAVAGGSFSDSSSIAARPHTTMRCVPPSVVVDLVVVYLLLLLETRSERWHTLFERFLPSRNCNPVRPVLDSVVQILVRLETRSSCRRSSRLPLLCRLILLFVVFWVPSIFDPVEEESRWWRGLLLLRLSSYHHHPALVRRRRTSR